MEEKHLIPSVPDTKKRLQAHGLANLTLAVGLFIQALPDIKDHLALLFPTAKNLPAIIAVIGALWSVYLRFTEASSRVLVQTEVREE